MQFPFPALQRLRFHFQALEPIRLPAFTGSAWRGLLGRGLRESACVTHQPHCAGCLLTRQCTYSVLFESPPSDTNVAARYSALPHPYVLEPDTETRCDIAPGETLTLGVNLIGPAIERVPYLIHAFQRVGNRGIGQRGGRFSLTTLYQEPQLGADTWVPIYTSARGALNPIDTHAPALPPAPPSVTCQVQTPLRLKHQGRFINARQLSAGDLLRALSSRIGVLANTYAHPKVPFDVPGIAEAARRVEISEKNLHWHEWTRYSSRQDTTMQMGGLIGRISLTGDGLQTLWPLLWLGQWTLLGKGTSFGLGRYRIAPPQACERRQPSPRAPQ